MLVKSHVFPSAFNTVIKGDDEFSLVVSPDPAKYPQRSHTGEYDHILCDACEQRLGPLDAYATRFFRDRDWRQAPRLSTIAGDAILVEAAELRLLRLFFLSIMLRAHWSRRPSFSAFDVGDHEQDLKMAIATMNPGPPHRFASTLYRYVAGPAGLDPGSFVLYPHRARMNDRNYVAFAFLGFCVAVKTDRRPFRAGFEPTTLDPGQPLVVPEVPFDGSRDFALILHIMGSRRR